MGETVCDPLTATEEPFRVALTALVVVHVRVEVPPDEMELGLALIVAVVTLTVASPQSVAPAEFLAVMRYVVVTVGETV